MNKLWNSIIEAIELKYEIESHDDWLKDNKLKLNKFKTSLENKTKESILSNDMIAKDFLNNKNKFSSFPKLSSEEKNKKINSAASKIIFNIDSRTLPKHLRSSFLPKHRKIRNMFSLYVYDCLYEQAIIKINFSESGNLSKDSIKEEYKKQLKLLQFQDTTWWVYYYHYNESLKQGMLGRAFLTIKDKNLVYLENVPDETASHFEGKASIDDSSQHLHLHLLSSPIEEKHLRITVFCGIGKVYPLYIGVYTNIYSANSMAAGSIVFHKIENPENTILEAKAFNFDDCHDEVPKSIIDFLRGREQNFIKSPSNLLTIKKLDEWLKIKNVKNKFQLQNNSKILYKN